MAILRVRNNPSEPWREINAIIGPKGDYWVPSVSENGDLSWTLKDSTQGSSPKDQNIRGPQGVSGVWVGTEAPTEEGYDVWVDTDGTPYGEFFGYDDGVVSESLGWSSKRIVQEVDKAITWQE